MKFKLEVVPNCVDTKVKKKKIARAVKCLSTDITEPARLF